MSEQARGQKGSRWRRERRRQIWRKTETRRRRNADGRDRGNPIMIWGHSVPMGLPALRVFGVGPEIRARIGLDQARGWAWGWNGGGAILALLLQAKSLPLDPSCLLSWVPHSCVSGVHAYVCLEGTGMRVAGSPLHRTSFTSCP